MDLTQNQLSLIAQIAPVFMLVFVVERREILRVIKKFGNVEIPGRFFGVLRRWQLRVWPVLTLSYMALLGGITVVAVAQAGKPGGLKRDDGGFLLFTSFAVSVGAGGVRLRSVDDLGGTQ